MLNAPVGINGLIEFKTIKCARIIFYIVFKIWYSRFMVCVEVVKNTWLDKFFSPTCEPYVDNFSDLNKLFQTLLVYFHDVF